MPSTDTVLIALTSAGIALTLLAGLFAVSRRRGSGWSSCLPGDGATVHGDARTPLLSGRTDGSLLAKAPGYEDEDGAATAESAQRFWRRSNHTIRWVIALQVLGALLSFGDALSSQLGSWDGEDHTTVHVSRPGIVSLWLRVGFWASLLLLSIILLLEQTATRRFALAITDLASNACLAGVILVDIVAALGTAHLRHWHVRDLALLAQAVAAAGALYLIGILPRRPEVQRVDSERAVDGQHASSILGRITFSWTTHLIRSFARETHDRIRDIDILPELDFKTRAASLRGAFIREKQNFENTKSQSPRRLWNHLARGNWPTLLAMACLVLLSSALGFAPQVFLFNILKSLEEAEGDEQSRTIWGMMPWVIGLGCTMVVSATIEEWLSWMAQSRLSITAYAQLGTVILAHAMHRKGPEVAADSGQPQPQAPNKGDSEDAKEPEPEPSQSAVNLVAVDTQRIADFLVFSPMIPTTIIKTLVSGVFLFKLIGWQSLLACLASFAILAPLNTHVTKRYGGAQMDLMALRDSKAAVVTELLNGISQVKFSALESLWTSKVEKARLSELSAQWRLFVLETCLVCIWILAPVLLSAVTLGIYAWIHGGLSASVAFTTLSIFGELEIWLALLPWLMAQLFQAWTSLTRIEQNLQEKVLPETRHYAEEICLENATLSWPSSGPPQRADMKTHVLKDINLRFPEKALSVILGKTGSGKSMILASILGECDVLEGKIWAPMTQQLPNVFSRHINPEQWIMGSACALVAQTPWIRNASVKDNILFELPFDGERYRKTIFACALNQDIQQWADGDETDLGENGVNLSGGQKWRISLARALYSRAGTLVIDDVFSALDANTARHVCQHALAGELAQGRTRILATHHVDLALPHADYVVHLDEGSVIYSGSPSGWGLSIDNTRASRKSLEAAQQHPEQEDAVMATEKIPAKKYLEQESHQVGRLRAGVIKEYLKASGGLITWGVIMLGYTGHSVLILARPWWINLWTRSSSFASVQPHQTYPRGEAMPTASDTTAWYLGVYFLIALATCLVGTFRYFLILFASLRASRRLFTDMLQAVVYAPLNWHNTVPSGRVLNRFTVDFHLIDSKLASELGSIIYSVMYLLTIVVAGCLVSPWIIAVAVFSTGASVYYATQYLSAAREIKRLESNTRSPIIDHLVSTMTGLKTIRAYGCVDEYIRHMCSKVDQHSRAAWYLALTNRWLGFRLSLVGTLFSVATGASVLLLDTKLSASEVGFVLGFALKFAATIDWAIRQYANFELDMNAAERCLEYSGVETENLDGDDDLPATWPSTGRLGVQHLSLGYSYKDHEAPVVKNVSFNIEPNTRLGVVGRTGAGKSTLALGIFRFLEAQQGAIFLDGRDISRVKLSDLRSRISIVPQDPFLFSGTVRSNIDPFSEFSDYELVGYLERVQLAGGEEPGDSPASTDSNEAGASSSREQEAAAHKHRGNICLDTHVSEGGSNLSHGQRQLVCLARAMATRPKFLVLDEATSAVDNNSDVCIQASIRANFGIDGASVLVIAHRIRTVIDFDQVLVMDRGQAVEFGRPRDLFDIEGGYFRRLVDESDDNGDLKKMMLGGR